MSEASNATPSAAPAEATATPVTAENTTETQSTEQSNQEKLSAQSSEDSISDDEAAAAMEEAIEEAGKGATNEQILKKYRVKIDGKEVEVGEDELLAGYQSRKSSQKRFEEAAKLRKQAEQYLELMKSAPAEVLSKLGVDVRDFAEKYLIDQIEEENLDPKEKELRAAKKELERIRQEKELEKRNQEQEQYAKMREHYETEIDQQIVESLTGSGLPNTPYTVKRVAQYLARAIDNNLDLQPKDVIKYVREDYEKDLMGFLGHYDGEALLNTLPKPILDKIRKASVTKYRSKQKVTPNKVEDVAKPESKEESSKNEKKMSMAEWREWVEKNS